MRAAKRFNLSMNADFLPEAIRAKEIFLWERVIGGHMFAARAQQKGIVPGNPKADVLASKIRRENDELIINAWHKASLITDKTRDSLMKTGIDAPLAPHFALYPNKKNKGRQ
ncbi:MAG: hypothetical protein JW772_00125 [Candidatus Diapherotrites archaeon]|nr:hypothetical protein [Candidatus Diapherotrites archaeon]